jgi:acid phosphatase
VESGRRPNPQERSLDASLWMQTSGEYRACCLQAYRLGWERLQKKLQNRPKEDKPPAVIMDLDETVLDNSAYQSWLYQSAQEYSDESWQLWERHPEQVTLVPGAFDFIEKVEQAGVTVVYLSNRFEEHRAETIAALRHLKINTKNIEKRLLLTKGPGDKTARRKKVAESYRVLMLFGDNLRDFNEVFKAAKVDPDDGAGQNKAIAERLRKVDEYREHWGDDWIILPNPVYGEWTKLVGSQPAANLRPKMREP